jgi:hypothetical protein
LTFCVLAGTSMAGDFVKKSTGLNEIMCVSHGICAAVSRLSSRVHSNSRPGSLPHGCCG